MAQIKGIDVSHWQGSIDWGKVKADGVEFVFIKATEGTSYVDHRFKDNVTGANAVGIKTGAYHYAKFGGVAEAKAEAYHFLNTVSGSTLTYPLVLDLEENITNTSKLGLTKAAVAFLNIIENAGHFVMLYSGKSFLENDLDEGRLISFAKWIARYSSKLDRSADIWQYTNEGRVNGISGNVDMNWAYRDFTQGVALHPSSTCQQVPPGYIEKPNTYTVKTGDSLSAIAARFGISVSALVRLNKISNQDLIGVGLELRLSEGSNAAHPDVAAYHTVVSGDTVTRLAIKYGTTTAQIKTWNGLIDVNKIYVGQKLRVN